MQIIQMKVAPGQTFKHEGTFHGPGSVLTMTAEDAEAAQKAGKVHPAGAPATPPEPESAPLSAEERRAAIEEAIGKVNPETFGTDGKPNTRAISSAAGFKVSAAERDEVWTAMQAPAPDENGEPGDDGQPGDTPAQPELPN